MLRVVWHTGYSSTNVCVLGDQLFQKSKHRARRGGRGSILPARLPANCVTKALLRSADGERSLTPSKNFNTLPYSKCTRPPLRTIKALCSWARSVWWDYNMCFRKGVYLADRQRSSLYPWHQKHSDPTQTRESSLVPPHGVFLSLSFKTLSCWHVYCRGPKPHAKNVIVLHFLVLLTCSRFLKEECHCLGHISLAKEIYIYCIKKCKPVFMWC